jgi:N-acetylglutamate synthase-like GNAT family acetyltransferase
LNGEKVEVIITKITDYNEIMQNEDIRRIISYAMYQPTLGKIQNISQSMYAKQQGRFYIAIENEKIVGIIGLKKIDNVKLEIMHIAVAEDMRKKGIGKKMIQEALVQDDVKEITAETDAEAKQFYKKCGFIIKKMPDKGYGVTRYLCTLVN